ncbi:MAG: hypothetical protein DDG60_00450 [Anaerolineae bacterium]|nr:MAG: hypothetical protein DDG60_00450 [Anaerolineae bacterium]
MRELGDFTQSEPLPDFLSGIIPETPQATSLTTEAQPGQLPDWLANLATETEPALDSAQSPAPSAPEKPSELETPALTLPNQEAATFSPEAQSIDSLLMDVPDWLAGFTPVAETEKTPQTTGTDQPDLQPVELPSWVQAMRPVETMLTGTESAETAEEEIEQKGPLAGFRSVLPAAGVLEIRKPRPYALKIQAGENQLAQAALLEKLLTAETEAKTLTPSEKATSLRPLRWLIFVILTLVVLLPSVLGTRLVPVPTLPANSNTPFNRFYDTLATSVPENALVLVVTDYQPGFAGEMEQAAVPVITHLMRKKAQISFISTSPISIEMGERLLEKSSTFYTENQQQPPDYQIGQQYLFLGYLPGGAAGVKSFAEQPHKMVGIDSVTGNLWQTDMLRDKISDISSFDALIVITDDPDNGRLWIEQTGAQRKNTPLLMVTSAQAGPLIQPYADSGQLSGLIVGLEGGVLYEQRDAQAGQIYPGHIKALYWDSFTAALIATLLAILFGTLWSMLERLRNQREDNEQDEAQ